jgi:hypothetical protein
MLQGTLDVFSLDEVLGLLSGANKSGVLNITGDRGVGAISIADGQLVGGSASSAPEVSDIAEVVFELLRFHEGSFSFDGDAVPDGDPHELDAVMESAHSRLTEWHGIEAVVPSLDHHLSLVDSLSTSQVTLNESEWSAIVAIGEGATVGVVAHRLDLGEFDGSKRVKGLIERSLAALTAAAPPRVEVVAEPISPVEPVVSDSIFETPEPSAVSLDSAALAGMVPDAPSIDSVATPESVVETMAASADAMTNEAVPPMPEAPDALAVGFGAVDTDEVPPMPEPPRPFGDEASLADEFAAPITAEDVDPVHTGDAPASSFAGLDPVDSADLFEPPLRADERPADSFAIAEVPEPTGEHSEIPSFAPPAFDPDAFGVNDTDDAAASEATAFAAEGSAFAAEGSAFAAEGSAFAAEGSAFAAEGSAFAAEGSAFAAEGSALDDGASDAAASDGVEVEDDAEPDAESEVHEKSGSLLMRYLKSNG